MELPTQIRVLMSDRSIRGMDLEVYLRGVVRAEMPPTWPPEALKAQAVAARCYAVRAVAAPRHAAEDMAGDSGSR